MVQNQIFSEKGYLEKMRLEIFLVLTSMFSSGRLFWAELWPFYVFCDFFYENELRGGKNDQTYKHIGVNRTVLRRSGYVRPQIVSGMPPGKNALVESKIRWM